MKKAIMAKGWVVRWWKKMKNGEWKKQNEKIIFDDAQKVFRSAEKKKRKGYIVQITPLSSPHIGHSGPIY